MSNDGLTFQLGSFVCYVKYFYIVPRSYNYGQCFSIPACRRLSVVDGSVYFRLAIWDDLPF